MGLISGRSTPERQRRTGYDGRLMTNDGQVAGGGRGTGGSGDPARLRKHSVTIAGHRTSVSLEDAFWRALHRIAEARGESVAALVTRIDRERIGNLSSALRVFVLESFEAVPAAGRPTSTGSSEYPE